MDKWLDPYLGPGATDVIWFSPHSERPEMLRNASCHCPAKPGEDCPLTEAQCRECTADQPSGEERS